MIMLYYEERFLNHEAHEEIHKMHEEEVFNLHSLQKYFTAYVKKRNA